MPARTSLALATLALSTVLVGCAAESRQDIPATAYVMNDAKGDITASAPDDGMVYVYDTNDDELVYAGQVMRGDVIRLDPEDHDVAINNRRVATKALDKDHRHQVYFDKAPTRTVIERQTTIVEPVPASDRQTTIVTPAPAQKETTIVSPNGGKTTVVTPSGSERHETIITTPSR